MSNTGAGPIHGCATRLLSQGAAMACNEIQPVHMLNHLAPPILSSFTARPVDPRSDYSIAIADRTVAAAYMIPQVVANAPAGLSNLGAGTRPKTTR